MSDARGIDEADDAPAPGRRIIAVAWWSNAVFALGTVGDLFGVEKAGGVATATCLVLFLVSLPIWVYALVAAIARSAAGDDIAVASLFFLQGSAPRRARWNLLGATGVAIVIATIVATVNPAAVLVPMLQLGLVGLWGARHGTFPPRRPRAAHER